MSDEAHGSENNGNQHVDTETHGSEESKATGGFDPFNPFDASSSDREAQEQWHAKDLGVPGLNILMGGGVPRGSLVIIVGPPGSGKTTLAYQIACAVARSGSNVITFTALSEPTSKLISHMRTFTFFDEQLIGGPLQIYSLQPSRATGLENTVVDLVAIARRSRADLVVLDGFRGVRGALPDPQAAREFLYSVGAQLGVLGITMLITSEAEPRDPAFFPEATTADVIIGLHYGIEGVRQRRAIEAVKVRGAQPLPGLHGLRLTRSGIVIFPRLEAQIAAAYDGSEDMLDAVESENRAGADDNALGDQWPQVGMRMRAEGKGADAAPLTADAEAASSLVGRAAFGLPAFDVLLGGGLTRESSTVVVGSPGTGKTLLALHFAITGVQRGEPCVYLGMRENRQQLLRKADSFALGSSLRSALGQTDALVLQLWPPVELDPDVVATHLLAAIDRTGARRVVIDSIGEIERTIARSGDAGRVDDFLAALVIAMRQRGVTALYIKEHTTLLAPEMAGATDALAVLAENVILMQHVSYRTELHRVLSVVKMRFSAHDTRLREFVIEPPKGIRVLMQDQSGAGVLEGIARDQEEAAHYLGRYSSLTAPSNASSGTSHASSALPTDNPEKARKARKPEKPES